MNKIKKIIAIILTALTIMGVFSSATTVIAADFSEAQARKAYFNENLSGYLKNIINTDNAVKIAEVEEAQKIEPTEESDIVTANANARTSTVQTYSSDETNDGTESKIDIDHTRLTLELDDGSETAYMFSEPVSFIDDNGELVYKDINIQLLSNAELNSLGYSYENGANDYKTYFGANSDNGIMLVNPNGNRVRIVPNSSITATGQIVTLEDDGKEFDAFLYNGVYDSNTSLRYAPQLNGIKEEIIVNSYTGKTTYEFTLYTENAVAAINSYGDIEIIDKNSCKIVDTFKAPFVYDSSEGFDQTSEHYADCVYGLEEVCEGQYNLTVSIPAEYLSAKTTQYPIIIDPTTSNISMTYDTSVYSALSTDSHSSNITACFGRTTSSEYGRGRAMFYFKIPSAIEKYAKISSAKLYLRETTGRTDTMYVRPYLIKDTWDNSVTWSTRPSYTTKISYPGKEDLALPRRNINSTSTDVSDSNYWYAFNITYAVRAWKSGTSNRGLVFIAECDSNSDDYLWRAFATKEHTTSSYRPYAVISYTNDTTVPVISSVSGNPTSYTNDDVTLKVTATDETYGVTEYSFDTGNGDKWGAQSSATISSNCTVKIKVKDYAGNVSETKTIKITKIDKTKPSATSTHDDATDNSTPVDVTITLTDNCSLKNYSLNGGSAVSISGTKKVITTTCEPGVTYSLTVTDTAGNKFSDNYSVPYRYPDDISEPEAPDIFEENGKVYINSRSFDFSEDVDMNEFISYSVGGRTYGGYDSSSISFDLVNTYDTTIEAWAHDAAGNIGERVSIDVDSKLGEYRNSYNDIVFGDGVFPVGFERVYSSNDGWFFTFNSNLADYRNGYVFTDFYGNKHHFISDENGEYFSIDGVELKVESGTIAGNSYAYCLEYDSLILYFDSSKKLAAVENEYSIATYTWTKRLLTIINKVKNEENDGYTEAATATICFTDNKPDDIMVTLTSSTETKIVSYHWDDNNLIKFVDAPGVAHNYAYNTDGLLANDDGVIIDYSNGRIKRITQKSGAFVKYTYNDTKASQDSTLPDNIGCVTIRDSKGVLDTFYYSDNIITSESGFNYTNESEYYPSYIDNSLTSDDTFSNVAYVIERSVDDNTDTDTDTALDEYTDNEYMEEDDISDLYDEYDDGSYIFYEYDENGRVITILEVAADTLSVTDTTTFADAEAVAETKTVTTYADEISDNVIEEFVLIRSSSGSLVNSKRMSYSYNSNGSITRYSDSSGFGTGWIETYIEQYFYDDFGNVTKEIVTESELISNEDNTPPQTITTVNTTSYVFDEWNQLIETVYDEGEETEFSVSTTYDLLGRVIEETYDDQTTEYTYDSEGNVIEINTPESISDYTYTNGLLMKRQDAYKYIVTDEEDDFIALYEYDDFGNLKSHTYRDYNFTYNTFGNILTANVGTQQIVEYEYTEDTKQDVVSAEYANEQVLTYLYTDDDWEIICLNDYVMYESCNVHNENGSITTTAKDLVNNINKITEGNGFTVSDSENQTLYSVQKYEKDETDENSFDGEIVNVGTNKYKFVSNNNEDTFSKNDTLLFSKTYEKDLSGKLTKETVNSNISTEYGYGANSMVTVLKNTVDDLLFSYNYSYDSNGNIIAENLTRKSVGNQGETIADSETTIYTYDYKNQLVSAESDTTKWEYTYDERGNILTRHQYNVSINNNGEKVYSFRDYDSWTLDSNWKDKLAKFNGQSITYDAIGNPLSYKGNTLTWTMGRQLASYGSNTYTYNEDGIRTSKTVNGVTTKYYLNGTDIIEQTDGTNTLHFYYDNTGEIIGFTYNDNQYFYIKNVQDDIIAIADNSGNIVSEYAYDPWGAVISVTGSNTEIGNLNPFRYRSYYYDSEIGMYYLQSRYYDPEICRFINCDDVNYIGLTESEISYNPFAYCENNAVNRVDPSGCFAGADHYKITYEIAKKYFNEEIAKALAEFSRMVDEIYPPVKEFYSAYSQSFHFDVESQRIGSKDSRDVRKEEFIEQGIECLKNASKSKKEEEKKLGVVFAIMYFGMALHPLQDKVAHSGPLGNADIRIYDSYGNYTVIFYFHYGESIDELTGEYLNTGKTKGSVAKSRTKKQIKKYVKYFKKYKLYKYVK